MGSAHTTPRFVMLGRAAAMMFMASVIVYSVIVAGVAVPGMRVRAGSVAAALAVIVQRRRESICEQIARQHRPSQRFPHDRHDDNLDKRDKTPLVSDTKFGPQALDENRAFRSIGTFFGTISLILLHTNCKYSSQSCQSRPSSFPAPRCQARQRSLAAAEFANWLSLWSSEFRPVVRRDAPRARGIWRGGRLFRRCSPEAGALARRDRASR